MTLLVINYKTWYFYNINFHDECNKLCFVDLVSLICFFFCTYKCILCHFILNNVKIVILYCTLYDLYTNEWNYSKLNYYNIYM